MPSLYEITVPVFIKKLNVLTAMLNKGNAHVGEAKISTLLESRLIEDMKPLIYQIQRVSDICKGLAVRLGGVENVTFEDNETTFAQTLERITKTIAFLESVPKEAFDNKEGTEVNIQAGSKTWTFTGLNYVNDFVIPNFYFHLVTTYALLRKEGVPVGKLDFLGAA